MLARSWLVGCGAGASPTAPSSVVSATASPTSASFAPTAATSASVPPASPAPASLAPFRIATGDILFNDSENSEVYAISADGTNRRHLPDVPGDWTAALSPDGTRIAWSRDPGDGRDIYVMGADGSDVRRLTGNDFSSYFQLVTRWVASCVRGLEAGALIEIDADGNNEVKVSAESDWFPGGRPTARTSCSREGARWRARHLRRQCRRLWCPSPDLPIPGRADPGLVARRQAHRLRSGSWRQEDVWVMHADGSSGPTDDRRQSQWPSFSPDGRSIPFGHGASTTSSDIWVMNADGTHPRPLTTTGHDWGPRWG
jgi:hypothetical protein